MSRAIDSLIAYRILRLLVIPFVDTDAYKLGIIDEKGKELKKMSQLNTVKERDAYTILHRMIFRLKRIIEKVPIENKKLASFAAALALIKEHENASTEPIDLEFLFTKQLKEDNSEELDLVIKFVNNKYLMTFRQFNEELAANAVGNQAIAGLGVGPEGEPGLTKKQRERYKLKNKNSSAVLLKRKEI